jgi:paraquat-inducible protein A
MHAHSRRALPLAVAGLFMYVVANVFPIMEIELHGISSQTTLIGSALSMNTKGMPLIASLVFTTTIALPLIQLFALIYLLICVSRPGKPAGFNFMVRMIQTFRPWIMVEILLLGAIVSFVKLTNMATVTAGPALWALGALALLLASVFSFDPKYIWRMSLLRNKGDQAIPMNRTRTGRSLAKATKAKAP